MHQQANGRVENRNKLIETYLRLYITDNSQWPMLIHIAEYVLNSQPSTSLDHKSPFEVDLGYVPKSPDAMLFPNNQESLSRQALDITQSLARYTNAAVAAHAAAFQLAKKYYDAKHTDVEYEIGSEVFVDNRFLNSHPDGHDSVFVPKLRTKFSGPFTILSKSGLVNYTLEMPSSYRGDPTFHISQLRLKKTVPSNYLVAPSEPVA
ncbi:retrotransposon protein (fragment), putative [Candida dubliniensis CD36]|uniref:Retrotransposon protein, putative n=1 Tax=Candida dubliniensis (strain CD36 / ATCC MYA-646 / CBS 7987 / NCPF 3949 / NRRL Y-17841) TaxID=573826 RepID=B9WA60_CANDC